LSVAAAEPALIAANGRSRGAQLRRFARRNPTIVAGGSILGLIALLALAAPLFAGDAVTMQPALRLRPPSEANWLGTDHLGRDVFARTVHGARVSLFVGISVAAMSISCGLFVGLMSGLLPQGRRGRDAADGRPDGDPGDSCWRSRWWR
jgi:peptide/nickel transport system permease protein